MATTTGAQATATRTSDSSRNHHGRPLWRAKAGSATSGTSLARTAAAAVVAAAATRRGRAVSRHTVATTAVTPERVDVAHAGHLQS